MNRKRYRNSRYFSRLSRAKLIHQFSFGCLVFCSLVITSNFVTQAQEVNEACKELPPTQDFYSVNDLIEPLQREIAVLEVQINDLKNVKIPQAKRELESKRSEPKAVGSEADLSSEDPVVRFAAELKQAEDDLTWKRAQVSCLKIRLKQYVSTFEQNFKMWMSLMFALLIGLVIGGFYLLAFKDVSVRRAVFSGPAGLQFIALFSIVIAIILFGITAILEAKELATLLASVSGYILGRTTANLGSGGVQNSSGDQGADGGGGGAGPPPGSGGSGGSGSGGGPPGGTTACTIEPATASASGGGIATIKGTNFKAIKSVIFGSSAASDVSIDDQYVITVTIPPHPEGAVDVVVEDDHGKKAKTTFEYSGG